MIGDKTLVDLAIESAIGSNSIEAVYVTSDDEAVLDISRLHNVNIIPRPPDLAVDTTTMVDVIKHAYGYIKSCGNNPGQAFCLLQPTSPLRTKFHVKDAVGLFKRNKVASVVSVTDVGEIPEKMLRMDNNYLVPVIDWNVLHANRQELPRAYKQNGAIWITDWQQFINHGAFAVSPCLPFYMPQEISLDIDTEEDLRVVESYILKNKASHDY